MRHDLTQLSSDQLNLTFAALADPTRRAILARLIAGHTTVTELAEPHDMSLPAISKHLRVLERSGLIERSREAQARPCHLKTERLKQACDWLECYRRHWEQSFDRLDDYLKKLQAASPVPTAARRPTRTRKNK
jgi:DNA-binding transcriptional ArsR family regulator